MTATAPQDAPPRRRRGLRRAARVAANVLIVAGALLLVDAVLSVLWQEPVSALYAHVEQGKLRSRLATLERTPLAPVERRAIARLPDDTTRLAFAARAYARRTKPGDPIGRIRMPSAGIDDVMVEGTAAGDLREGPGHYPATPLPGQRGTVGIAGHRTTYGAPFRHIDRAHPGDEVQLTTPYGVFDYRVQETRIVPPTALWVTRRVGYDRLILSACHPLYSAAKRIVVFARLVSARSRVTR